MTWRDIAMLLSFFLYLLQITHDDPQKMAGDFGWYSGLWIALVWPIPFCPAKPRIAATTNLDVVQYCPTDLSCGKEALKNDFGADILAVIALLTSLVG